MRLSNFFNMMWNQGSLYQSPYQSHYQNPPNQANTFLPEPQLSNRPIESPHPPGPAAEGSKPQSGTILQKIREEYVKRLNSELGITNHPWQDGIVNGSTTTVKDNGNKGVQADPLQSQAAQSKVSTKPQRKREKEQNEGNVQEEGLVREFEQLIRKIMQEFKGEYSSLLKENDKLRKENMDLQQKLDEIKWIIIKE